MTSPGLQTPPPATSAADPAPRRAASADDVVRAMCEAYEQAVNASDAGAYAELFAPDAIRMPPDTDPEHGRDQIRNGEQAEYDSVRLDIQSRPLDAIQVGDDWIYGIAQVEGTATGHVDGATSRFGVTKTWLLQRQRSGQWLIVRQMWHQRAHSR